MLHQLFKITQNAIIKNNEGAVLVLKHPNGKWLLPGGRINEGENWLEALQREVKEEIGIIDLKIEDIVDIDSWLEDKEGFYVVTFIISTSQTNEIKLSEEHAKYAWISADDLDNYDFWHEKIKERIKKSFNL